MDPWHVVPPLARTVSSGSGGDPTPTPFPVSGLQSYSGDHSQSFGPSVPGLAAARRAAELVFLGLHVEEKGIPCNWLSDHLSVVGLEYELFFVASPWTVYVLWSFLIFGGARC